MSTKPCKISIFVKQTFVLLCFFAFSTNIAKASISSITINAETGQVISSNNANEQRYPASLTKLMTLYITFDALEKGLIKMDTPLQVSRAAANRAPSRLGVQAGQTIKVRTAVMALVVKSANDCATILAENLGGSEDNFAQTMTKVAKELGMKNTTFKNASGLPNREQKTTAKDMALLGAAIYHHFPQYYKLFSAKTFTYNGRTHYTHNKVLNRFDGADGMKTGFTNAAGYNIVTSAEKNGQRVISVTMGHKTARDRDKQVCSMMEKGLTKMALLDKGNKSSTYADIEAKEKSAKRKELLVKTALVLPKEETNTTTYEYHEEDVQYMGDLSATEPKEEIVEKSNPISIKNSFAIQVGAFSNYTKARNYALQIKNEIPQNLSEENVNIEAVEKDSAVIYRSKIVGLAKKDAENACKSLKRSKKSCIVTAMTNKNLILAHNDYTNNK